MLKYDAREIRAIFDRGENIMQALRTREGNAENSPTSILYSYDAQAGSYVERMADESHASLKSRIGKRIAAVLDEYSPSSLLDAGVGEATTLAPILGNLTLPVQNVLGFDISLSRLLVARQHLARHKRSALLFAAELDRVPLANDSVDVVLSVHALEPNHGQEETILKELLRVAAKALVLVEPSWELGFEATRARIERLGYVRGLPTVLERLGHPPVRLERFEMDVNPANEAALIVVRKNVPGPGGVPRFVSPISGKPLNVRPDCLFCPEDGHAFPIIDGIPCLTVGSAVLASKLGQF